MSFSCRTLRGVMFTAAIMLSPVRTSAAPAPLMMQEAVTLALQHDSVLQQLAADKQSVVAQATAAGQLPDPKLSAGIVNQIGRASCRERV